MDKILRIDVGAKGGPKATVTPLGDYAGMGGRGMTSMIVSNEVPADCHPLGLENKLVIAPGLMTGSAASTSGRISIGCKSPLTGGIKEANAGGQAGQVMARLGYAAIILEGAAQGGDLYQVFINKDKVEITSANDFKMMTNYDLVGKDEGPYGEKTAMISIGPAGEMKMCAASIAITDREFRPTRHAGRGGVGAVMGAKGIKAIILDDAGCKMRKPHRSRKIQGRQQNVCGWPEQTCRDGTGLPAYGTNVLTNVINEAGAYPTYNFKQGQYADALKISGEARPNWKQNAAEIPPTAAMSAAPSDAPASIMDKDGNYVTKQPEYETVWAHGGNCGICDLDAIARLDFMDDNYRAGHHRDGGHHRHRHGGRADQLRRRRRRHQVARGGRPRERPLGADSGSWRRSYGQGLWRRAGPRGEKPGDARLRPPGRQGHRRHLRHKHPGRRPYGRLRHRHQHPQGRRRCGSPGERRARSN